ncbi:DUF4369 domain-containing protein [Chitinophaga sedimenti]|uniref:DUF4369 domain-containing protein n=1 Tax=Chitinophaga sedimenti TaxID=2033606 RepID=UPI002003A9F8|nr:DUF4369 domain-containing protein [Chitinophaga sedimenti]MCK7558445.1 DUF4369 domain-containing protein [Chitinophaga sedimenti]
MHRIIGIITAGCLFSQALSAQKAFVVKGDLKDTAYDGQKANLSYLENGAKVYKTATIKDGKFLMEGTVTDPALVTISTGTTKKRAKRIRLSPASSCRFSWKVERSPLPVPR